MKIAISFLITFVIGHCCVSIRGDIKVDGNERKTYTVYSPRNRDDYLLSDPRNASLYFDYPKHRTLVRISRALDLDVYLGDAKKRQQSGTRQSRILNDDSEKQKPNLAIQGFIPIVSVGSQGQPNLPSPPLDEQNLNEQPGYATSQQGYAGPGDAKFIGAALHNLAQRLGANPKRKFSYDYLNNNGVNKNQDCICVPFYMCKNGFLEQSAKSAQKNAYPTNSFEQSLAAAQTEIDRQSIPAHLNAFYEQQKFIQNNNENLAPAALVDERSIDGSPKNNNQTTPEYVSDVFSKILARSSEGSTNCGLLRTCCRVIPDYGPEISEIPSPVYNPPVADFQGLPPNSFYPVPHQEPNLPFLRPEPVRQFYGTHQRPQRIASGLSPSSLIPHQPPQRFSFRPVNSVRPAFNLAAIKPPAPAYIDQVYRPDVVPMPAPTNHIGYSRQSLCGIRNAVGIHGRVQNLQYHESSTEFGEYPWQVAILKRLGPADSLYVCGGVLISDQWVATAAHCIKKNSASDLKVRLGEWDVHRDDEFYPFVEKFIDEIIVHPQFYPGNLINDIALFRLDSPVDLNVPHIATACLPDRFESFVGHRCWVTGWGKDSFGHKGAFQSVLREVDLPIVNQAQCEHVLRKTRLGPYYELHPGFMCAGGEPGKDACEGDGGSPLVCDVRGVWKAVGLVSWGIGCGQPGVPGVYVNMAHYRDWIDTITHKYASLNSAYDTSGIIERSNANAGNSSELSLLQKYSVENYRENATSTTVLSTSVDN